jgi:SAM-dependent methyltransferase
MQDEIYREMYRVEDRHWWFAGKRRIIRALVSRYVPPREGRAMRIADLGCGCGRNLEELPEGYTGVGLDASPIAIDFCRQRGVDARLGSLPGDVSLPQDAFDAVVMADVLEHIDDDVAAARAAARIVAPGGILVVTVPAIPSLWSSWDEIHGHKRRYSRKALRGILASTGLKKEFVSYYNTALLAPAVAFRLVRKLTKRRGTGELKVTESHVNDALEAIFASERHILGRIPLPIGLSLVAVMRKE